VHYTSVLLSARDEKSSMVPGLKAGLGGLRPTGLERQMPPPVLQDLSPKAPSRGFSPGTGRHLQTRLASSLAQIGARELERH